MIADHSGPSHLYYLDVPLDETVRRNRVRAASDGFTAADMRSWYAPQDVLGLPGEQILPGSSTPEQTIDTILHTSGLAAAAALTPCPTRCPRCAEKAVGSPNPAKWT